MSSTAFPTVRWATVDRLLMWLPGPPRYTLSISSTLLEIVLLTSEKYFIELSSSFENLAIGIDNNC